MKELLLTKSEIELLTPRSSLPPWQRHIPMPVWSIRTVNGSSPIPQITAAYHSSATMPPEHVASKGLHVPVVATSHGPRRLCKWEVLHSMGMPMQIVLPQPEDAAISLLGQTFPPVYAFLGMAQALALRPEDPWTQDRLNECVAQGIMDLAPRRVEWEALTEVGFQGWVILATEHEKECVCDTLARRVMSMWPDKILCTLCLRDPIPEVHGNEPPAEVSFFSDADDRQTEALF